MEYKYVSALAAYDDPVDKCLKKEAAGGWEFVQAIALGDKVGMFFKRPKNKKPEEKSTTQEKPGRGSGWGS